MYQSQAKMNTIHLFEFNFDIMELTLKLTFQSWILVGCNKKLNNTWEHDKVWQAKVYEGWASKLIDRQIHLLKTFDIFRCWWVLTIILEKCLIILSAELIVVTCRNLPDENSQSYLSIQSWQKDEMIWYWTILIVDWWFQNYNK